MCLSKRSRFALFMSEHKDLILIQKTDKPVCYNYFSFLNDEEKRKNIHPAFGQS